MKKLFFLIILVITSLTGCSHQTDDYIAVASFSKDGFARDDKQIIELYGKEIKIWGFVDHTNLYGDGGTRTILEDWWSGYGPDASTWRFNLKARENDEAGHSFPVYVPNDQGRELCLSAHQAYFLDRYLL